MVQTERLDLRCVACALVEFCIQKAFKLEIRNFSGILSWLDNLLKFQFSANRVNVRVACLNPEIWWFLWDRLPVGLDLFLE